ncbi:MAG: beta-galactosidase [Anaerolineae bacterium]
MTHAHRTTKLFQKPLHGADYNYEQWLEYPDVLDEDFRLMRLSHCNVMNIGIFSWAMLEPAEGQYQFDWLDTLMNRLAENDMYAVLATPSAAPPAWLSRQYPQIRRINELGHREPHKGRQNFCPTSPIYREKVTAINTQLAQRYRNHPALLLWHISNEYGGVHCHCDLCYHEFREWLKARYGTLDKLNRAWWTSFWSHRYTEWEQIEPVDGSVQGLMLDWKRFTSDRNLDFFLMECVPLREATPDVPITTNFMQPDVGLNYWDFAPHIDVISWDSYPRWHQGDDVAMAAQTAFYHDIHRSYKRQPFLLMESTPSVTNWQAVSKLKKPGMHQLSSLQAVAHGSNSVQYFQWRQSRGGEEKFHGAVVTHLGSEHTRTFNEVTEVGSILQSISSVTQTTLHAPVAVIYDTENEWALNFAKMPGNMAKHYQETCRRHHLPFWKRDIPVDVINAEADFSVYRVLVAPMLYMLHPGVAERVEQFVQAGGIFVTTYISGLVDESDLTFLNGYPAPLRRTLGIYAEEWDALMPHETGEIQLAANVLGLQGVYQFRDYAELIHSESAQTLATYNSDFYTGRPALTVNAHGSGHAYFIAARTEDRFLDDFYGSVLRQANITPPLTVPTGVSVQVREGEDQRYLFLMNFSQQSQQISVGAGFHDALIDKPAAEALVLAPYGMAILVQEKVAQKV